MPTAFRAIVIAATLPLCLLRSGAAAELSSETPAARVRCGKVTKQRTSRAKSFVGSIVPARRSLVGAAVAGRVEHVFVETGDAVDESGVLVELRSTSVKIMLAAAKAQLEAEQHSLDELISGPRKEELQRLEALVKAIGGRKVQTEKHFQRIQELSNRGAAAQGVLEQALSAKVNAEQTYIATQAEYQAALAGTRKEQLARARALVTKAEEEVNRMSDRLDEHEIRSPFRGYVVKRLVEKGQWVAIGDPIAEVIEIDPAEMTAAVPQEHIANIRRGQPVRVEVHGLDAHPDNRVLLGEVFRIVPDADARTRTFPVRIRIPNALQGGQPRLKPGMMARAYLPVGAATELLVVAQDALVLDRDQTYLFVAEGQFVLNNCKTHRSRGRGR